MRGAGLTAAVFALVAGTGFTQGGYFPGTWGWATLGGAWAAAAALVARDRVELSRPAAAAALLLVALTAWNVLSSFWSVDITQSALEAERTAVYAAALLAALLWARDRPERLLRGTWFAIVCVCTWALATRLVPDRWGRLDLFAGYRLSEPIGYWNALGLFATIGALLALGIAARGETRAGRALVAASLPVLVTTLYFTYSRGAWIALGLGLLAMLALDARRLQLSVTAIATLPWAAVAVWRASVSPALTTLGRSFSEQAHEGHRLVAVLAALTAGAALCGLLATWLDPRITIPRRWRPALAALVVAALAAALGGVFVHYGSPTSLAERGWHSFATGGPPASNTLNNRLFSFSGTGRVDQWRVGWREAMDHPALGTGAGTFEVYWNAHRPNASRVRDVHNLYIETFAELGIPGLAFLLGVLGLAFAAAVRLRTRALASSAAGALAAYAAHAAVDWDWEIASVTLAAVICAAYLLAGGSRLGRAASRITIAVALLLAVGGLYTIATRVPMNRLSTAAAHGQWAAADRDARRAAALAPWSAEPWHDLGESELNAGRPGQARGYFLKAVARESRNWVNWYDLARASSGHERRAALAQARALNPRSPEIAAVRP